MKKALLYSSLFLLVSGISSAQIITTVAGNHAYGAGFSGDGGPATAAEMNIPAHIRCDNSGNYYIGDASNSRIRKVNATGIISTFAGNGWPGFSGDGGPATAAEIWYPYGMATDKAGNLYFADEANNVIRKINTAGIISSVAGYNAFGAGYSGDGGQATAAELYNPAGVLVDDSGVIYIADCLNSVIRKVDTHGIIRTIAGNHSLGLGYSGDGGLATNAEINGPNELAMDKSGNIYFADLGNNVVRKISTAGIITTIAGNGVQGFSGDGGQATAAELWRPSSLAMDSIDQLYICDQENNVVRKIDFFQNITTIVGNNQPGFYGDGGPATAAELHLQEGIALDPKGNLYIADDLNGVIREVTGLPAVLTGASESNGAIQLYPNPNSGQFTLSVNSVTGKSQFMVYSILGEQVSQFSINTTSIQIDLSNKAVGLYLYRVVTETGNLVSEGKFIIQK
ncbi:MAG TPA: T9SS type A sorting domain-containing protein [Bacteroidia bacterium]|nr:T9SS type A sorting domain-containing protein [Bacteroidia bacterium]